MTRLRRLTPTICAFHLGFGLEDGPAPSLVLLHMRISPWYQFRGARGRVRGGNVPLVSTADDAAAGAYPHDGGAGAGRYTPAAYGRLGAVTETPPAGSGCASSGLDDEEGQATRPVGQIHPAGGQSIHTSLTCPARKRAYPFSGMLRDSDRKDTPAGDASWGRATVSSPAIPSPCVRPTNNSPTFPVEAASVFAGVAGRSTLLLTTTVLPEHPVRSVNGHFRNWEAPAVPAPTLVLPASDRPLAGLSGGTPRLFRTPNGGHLAPPFTPTLRGTGQAAGPGNCSPHSRRRTGIDVSVRILDEDVPTHLGVNLRVEEC